MTYSFSSFESVHFSLSGSKLLLLDLHKVSQEAGKVAYSHLFKNFPQLVVVHTKTLEVDVFLDEGLGVTVWWVHSLLGLIKKKFWNG